MKIAFIIKNFYPFRGGAENYFKNLACETAKDGNDVTVFTTYECESDKNCKILNLKINRYKKLLNLSYFFYIVPGFLNVLFGDFEIVHVSGIGHIWIDFIVFLIKIFKPKTKIFNTPHGPFMPLSYNFLLTVLKKTYDFCLSIFSNFLYDIVFDVNGSQKSWISGLYKIDKEKIKFLPPTFFMKEVDGLSNISGKLKEKLKLNKKIIALTFGRINMYKGFDKVFEALKQIKNLQNFQYIIAGRYENDTDKVINLVNKENLSSFVTFIKNPTDEEREAILKMCDFFIFPSKWEAFGIVLLEAMSKGKFVITSNTEGGKFFKKNCPDGVLIYNYDDCKKLSEHIVYCLKNVDIIKKKGKNNIKFAMQFLPKIVYEKYYKKLIEKRNIN